MRLLSKAELELVSGGETIVVTGRGGYRTIDWDRFVFDNASYEDNYYSGGDEGGPEDVPPPSEPNGMTADEQESVEEMLAAIAAGIQELIQAHGPNAQVRIGDQVYRLGDIAGALGNTMDIIAAGNLVAEISQGNASVGEVAGFLVGLGIGAAAAAAGAGAIGILLASTVAEVTYGEYIDMLGETMQEVWENGDQQVYHWDPLTDLGLQIYQSFGGSPGYSPPY